MRKAILPRERSKRLFLNQSCRCLLFLVCRTTVLAAPGADDAIRAPAAPWLEQRLDFPAWTPASIARMPVTPISEWAKANRLEVDRAYATEMREGGTRALGTDVPPLTRSELTVFSPEQWETEQSHLTYEAWLSAAQSQLTGQGLPAYDVHRARSPIRIDGKLDDAAWATAAAVSPFHFNRWIRGEQEQTEVKMLWDDEYLYVAYFCHDRHISAKITQRHGPVSSDDCVELFVSPNPYKVKNYYTFEINAIGTMLNRCRTDWWHGPPTWEPVGVLIGTSLPRGVRKLEADSDRSWVVELAVPLQNFSRDGAHTPPRSGDLWRLNLNRTGGMTNPQNSTWSPLPPQVRSVHTPSAFGMIRFVDGGPDRHERKPLPSEPAGGLAP